MHGCTALPPKGPLIHPPHAPRAAHNHDMKSRVHPKYKTKYHIRNWASYERALVHRGDGHRVAIPSSHRGVGA